MQSKKDGSMIQLYKGQYNDARKLLQVSGKLIGKFCVNH